jgi:translation initiation factor 5A
MRHHLPCWTAQVPNVSRTEYSLVDINDEGFVTLMSENGTTREDMRLPSGTDDYDKLAEQIQNDFIEGKDITVGVLKVMCLL